MSINFRCLFGFHKEKENPECTETIGKDKNIVFIYYRCRFCNKIRVTIIGYGGISIKNWKTPSLADLFTINNLKKEVLK